MTRLIDADAFTIIKVKTKVNGKTVFAEMMQKVLDTAPTVDAVPVIRCKDCARNPKDGHARIICPCPMDRYMGDEGFCSKAEPKVKK